MAQGLEIFDETGKRVMDSSTHVSFVLGVITVEELEGTHTDPRLLEGRPFYYTPGGDASVGIVGAINKPRVRIEGDTITWTANSRWLGLKIIYGIIP